MQFKEFKVRCSQIGQIVKEPREKKNIISATTQTFIEQWIKEQVYKRQKDFSSKYTEKGIQMENESIEFLSQHLDIGLIFKNEKYFENDYFTGSPDVVLEDCIIDVKNSWDAFTFPLFDTEIPNSDYYFQGQIYMALTGKKHYKLIYTLLDTPMDIIQKEAFFFARDNGLELNDELINEFRERNSFSSIDPKYRIKVFEFEYDQPTIDKLISRVIESRIYLSNLPI
jgi:hypothetical protein